jgi:hypothetical protein
VKKYLPPFCWTNHNFHFGTPTDSLPAFTSLYLRIPITILYKRPSILYNEILCIIYLCHYGGFRPCQSSDIVLSRQLCNELWRLWKVHVWTMPVSVAPSTFLFLCLFYSNFILMINTEIRNTRNKSRRRNIQQSIPLRKHVVVKLRSLFPNPPFILIRIIIHPRCWNVPILIIPVALGCFEMKRIVVLWPM